MPVTFITVLFVLFRQKSISFHADKKFRFVILVFELVLLWFTKFSLNQNALEVQIFSSGTYSIKKPFTCLKI